MDPDVLGVLPSTRLHHRPPRSNNVAHGKTKITPNPYRTLGESGATNKGKRGKKKLSITFLSFI